MKRFLKLYPYKFDDVNLFVSLGQSYDELNRSLIHSGISPIDANEAINNGRKLNVLGRTTSIPSDKIIVVKLNYFDNNIRSIAILSHELNHASRRILDIYETESNRNLSNREEAECYLSEYLFESAMIELKPDIDYTEQKRNFNWLEEITHSLE